MPPDSPVLLPWSSARVWAFVVTPGNDEPLRRPPGVLGVLGGDALLGPGAAPDDLRQDAASTEKKSSKI